MKKFRDLPLYLKITLCISSICVFLWYWLPVEGASIAWDGGGVDANWSTGANWVGDVVPGNLDTAVFDATACGANCNPTIGVNMSVRGISMTAGTHTITQAPGVTINIGVAGYAQAGAGNIFVGGDSLMQVDGTFTMTSGTFTPTSGMFKLKTNFALNGGTINGSGKTMTFAGDSFSSGGQFSCTGDFNTTTGLAVSFTEEYNLSSLNTGCTLSALVNTDYLTGYSGHISVATGAVLNATGSTWNSGGVTVNGTVNFNGTSFTSSYLNIPSGGVVSLPNATTFVVGIASDGDLTVSSGGTLTYGGTNFQVNGLYAALSGTFDESGKNLTLGGNGYTIVNCTGDFNTLTGLSSVVMNKNNTYGDPDMALGTGCTLTLDSVTSPTLDDGSLFSIEGTLNITGDADFGNQSGNSGAIIAVLDGGSLTMTGDYWTSGQIEVGGTFTSTASTRVKVYGALYLSRFGNPGTFNAGPLTQLIESQDGYTGDFSINGGTYNANSGTLEVANDFAGSALFDADTGTVNLNGTSLQAISGDTTFYNLTATSSIARTLRFANTSTQIISNNLTLRGSSGALISLISNSTPTQWKINGQGTNTLCYLSVKDSNNLNVVALSGYQLTDATGNTNWDFISTSSCGTPTPTVEFSATTGSGSESTASPTVTVTLSATSASNVTVEYGITGGTATGSGTDYTLASGTATILAGATTTTIPLTIINDSSVESDETVIISLSSPSNATLGSNISLTYTITNDDTASSGGGGGGGSTGANGPIVGALNPVPKNSVKINNGSATTNSKKVDVAITHIPNVVEMMLSSNESFKSAKKEPVVSVKTIDLCTEESCSPGLYKIFAKFFDIKDEVVEVVSDDIVLIAFSAENMDACIAVAPQLTKATTVFSRDLELKQTDQTVKVLQVFLNQNNFIVAKKGEGSLGQENTYFGPSTQHALKSFQTVYEKVITAYFGPIKKTGVLDKPTRDFINSVATWKETVCGRTEPPLPPPIPPPVLNPPLPPLPPPPVVVVPPPLTPPSVPLEPVSPGGSYPEQNNNLFEPVSTTTTPTTSEVIASNNSNTVSPPLESIGSGPLGSVLSAVLEFASSTYSYVDTALPRVTAEVENINKTIAYVAVPVATAVAYVVPLQEKIIRVNTMRDVGLMLIQAFQSLLAFLGLRQKRRHWGTVYDSKSKQPIDPAIVQLVDAQSGAVVEESVTDMAGRYGFLTRSGKFYIRAEKTNYAFPAKNVTGKNDEIFDNLYYGEEFTMTDVSNLIVPNIPMDPVAFDWNQMDKKRIIKLHPHLEYAFTVFTKSLYWIGFALSLFVYSRDTSIANLAVLGMYAVVMVISVMLSYIRLWGRVYSSNGTPISDALIELASPKFDSVVIGKAKSAVDGRFFLKAFEGAYQLKIKKIDPVTNNVIEIDSKPVVVKKVGVFNKDVYVQ